MKKILVVLGAVAMFLAGFLIGLPEDFGVISMVISAVGGALLGASLSIE